jgi:NAD-reducing hydrogenase small subunit
VTGNVTALRNPLGAVEPVLRRSYIDYADLQPQIPADPAIVPVLLEQVVPVHSVVAVDHFVPGCPPPAPRIRAVLESLLAGETPRLEGRQIKFG